jgi:hypothetical protein
VGFNMVGGRSPFQRPHLRLWRSPRNRPSLKLRNARAVR